MPWESLVRWLQEVFGMVPDTGKGTPGEDAEEPAEEASATANTPRGSVEADKAGYASELVAYRGRDKLAGTIADDVRGALGNDARVLVVDDLERLAGGTALA